jgi:hypothetical protein
MLRFKLTNKKRHKFFRILAKFNVYYKFPHNFQIYAYKNFVEKNCRKPCKLAAPNYLCRNFFCFTGKICLYLISCAYRKQDFSLFLLMAMPVCIKHGLLCTDTLIRILVLSVGNLALEIL